MIVRPHALLALLLCLAPVVAQEAPEAPPALNPGLEPIRIGDKTISTREIKRALVYTVGTNVLESRKLDILIQAELRRLVEAGADQARFGVQPAEVDKAIAEGTQQIELQYPGVPLKTILGSNNLTPELWRSQIEQAKLFDQIFLPDDPALWPETTRMALEANNGPEFVTKIQDAFRLQLEKKAAEAAAVADGTAPTPAAPADPQAEMGKNMLRMILRQMITGQLTKSAVIKLASDGLPEDVALEVNGVRVLTDDLYNALASRLGPEEYRTTRRWLVKSAVVEDALRQSGHWLSDEEFAQIWAEHQAPYEKSPITLGVLVVSFKKFPSLESYRDYYRLLESYRKMIAAEFDEKRLAQHLPRANSLMGLAQVDAEAILISAYDFGTQSWRADGWEGARGRAADVARELAQGGDWDALLESRSEFWDPPQPKNPQQLQQAAPPKPLAKGKLGLSNRNELLQKVGESEYSMFLDGSSVGDYMFFEQEAGTVDGPFRGRFGYYITRVKGRTPPVQQMALENPDQRKLVEADYLQMRFCRWAEEQMQKAGPAVAQL